MTKKINVISWDDAMKMLPTPNPNKEFCDLVSKVCEVLKTDKKDYVYHIQLEFGEKFIDKGARCLFEDNGFTFENKITGVTKNKHDFKNDLDYTLDPLGMVIKNHIEVYSENEISKSGSSINKYRVHLNSIKEGELFGLFGTLDYFNNDKKNNNQDWYAMVGNSCFEILFPFQNDTVYTEITKITNPNSSFLNKQIATTVDNKINFFKSYVNICDKNWRTDIVYFPKHFIEANNSEFKIKLFEIGWAQSKSSRNFLFENKALSDIIDEVGGKTTLKNNKHLLNFLLDYIIKASTGDAYVLKPLKDDKHILNVALDKFKQDISAYLSKSKNHTPVILHYDTIAIKNDWGCLAIDSLPILLNYPQINPNGLEEDLNNINKKNSKSLSLPDFYTTADKFTPTSENNNADRYKGRTTLENGIKTALSLDSGKIALTTKWLSNFIVINDKIK